MGLLNNLKTCSARLKQLPKLLTIECRAMNSCYVTVPERFRIDKNIQGSGRPSGIPAMAIAFRRRLEICLSRNNFIS